VRVTDLFWSAWGSLKQRRLRAALSTLGIVIGIAAIVALLSLTAGFQAAVTGQIQQSLGLDTLTVTVSDFEPGQGPSSLGTGSFSLRIADAAQIEGLPGVLFATPLLESRATLSSQGNSMGATAVGVNFREYTLAVPDAFKAIDGVIPDSPSRDAAVVGFGVAYPSSGDIENFVQVGDRVTISVLSRQGEQAVPRSHTFVVVAILEEVGGFNPNDNRIFVPTDTAAALLGSEEASSIIVKVVDRAEADAIAADIEALYNDQVNVISPSAFLRQAQAIFSTFDLFLGGIAAISLLVAGIGIMNIMIVSVVERTREIGILKALGAKSRSVLTIFLSEAVLIGVLGGLLGIAVGLGIAEGIAELISRGALFGSPGGDSGNGPSTLAVTPVLTPTLAGGAFGFAIAIATLFGFYPALRASRKQPVEALRYE
jgi:putative ABC transport system permease protein